jgi:hypothetical protein
MFIFDTPIASYNMPANITSMIPGYAELVKDQGAISLRLTIGENKPEEGLTGLTKLVDFKLEIINEKGNTLSTVSNFNGEISRMLKVNTGVNKPAYWGAYTRKDSKTAFSFAPASWNSTTTNKVTTNTITVKNNSNSEYIGMAYTPKFTDVSDKKLWYYDYVTTAASKKLVRGVNTEETIFDPEKQVTKAEFVTMMVRALRLPEAAKDTAAYADLTAAHWAYNDVMAAKSAELLILLGKENFNPDQAMTREEMAYVLSRAAIYCKIKEVKGDLTVFTDAANIHIDLKRHVENAVGLKLMNGMTAATFEAKGNMTRAQAATVLIRFCQLEDLKWIDVPAAEAE